MEIHALRAWVRTWPLMARSGYPPSHRVMTGAMLPSSPMSTPAAGASGAHPPRVPRRLGRRARRTIVRLRGQRVLAILGMHRSGTSSLAGSLEAAGLYLGEDDVDRASQWNAKGYRESRVLNRLHEQLLVANGGSWEDPPEVVSWSEDHRRRRDGFIRSRATKRYWGFKDPRTILLIDGWLEALPEMGIVATLRDPTTVARSLQRRQQTATAEEWLDLWLVYNRRLWVLHSQRGFPIIDFDLPPAAYQQRLTTLIGELGLRPAVPGESFFEPPLRDHQSSPRLALPTEVEELHEELKRIAAEQAAPVRASI